MKPFLLLIVALFATTTLFAQKGFIRFKNPEIELKDLKADDIPTEVKFTFTNTGKAPVIIKRVSGMSIRMQTQWSKKPIAPGESSDIRISFLSMSMPKNFNYTAIVHSNAANPEETLRLKANIVDNPLKPELLYRYDLSGLKFKTGYIDFQNVYTQETVKDTLYYFNTLDSIVTLSTLYAPPYIDLEFIPEKIQPKKRGMIILTYKGAETNDYGYLYDMVALRLNNQNSYHNRISVSARITEDFSKLTEKELAEAPVAHFEKKNIGFGEIQPGKKVNCDFLLINKGKSNLIVRKIKTSCGCTAVTVGQTTLAPGQKTTIRAIFDSAGRSGRQYKSVSVITNDPKNPEITLNLSGTVAERK